MSILIKYNMFAANLYLEWKIGSTNTKEKSLLIYKSSSSTFLKFECFS